MEEKLIPHLSNGAGKDGTGRDFLWVRRKKRDRENGEDFSSLEKEEEEEKEAPMINDATAAAAARAQSPEKLSSRLLLLLPSAPGKKKSFGSDFLRLPGCSERKGI